MKSITYIKLGRCRQLLALCFLLVASWSMVRAQVSHRSQNEKMIALNNVHLDGAQYSLASSDTLGKWDGFYQWPNVATIDLTPSLNKMSIDGTENGLILGSFHVDEKSEGAVLFSMSEDFAMVTDGEFLNKEETGVEPPGYAQNQGEIRNLLVLGVGKIPGDLMSQLAIYATPNSQSHTDYQDALAANNQSVYAIVVNDSVVTQFLFGTSTVDYLDNDWHNFVLYAFPSGLTGAQDLHEVAADAFQLVIDGEVVHTQALYRSEGRVHNRFWDVGFSQYQVHTVKTPRHNITHSLIGGINLRGKVVTGVKSDLQVDNFGFFVGADPIHKLKTALIGGDNQAKMRHLSESIGVNDLGIPSNLFDEVNDPAWGTDAFYLQCESPDKRHVVSVDRTGGSDPAFYGLINHGLKTEHVNPTQQAHLAYYTDCSVPLPANATKMDETLKILRCPQNYPDYKMVVSHRGYHRDVPEHSLPSVNYAVELVENGYADFIELDVKFTKDLQPVLTHDKYFELLSDGPAYPANINDTKWSEVKNYHLKDYQGNVTTHKFVHLEQAMQIIKGKSYLLLDIKAASAGLYKDRALRCLKIADELGMLHQIIIGGGSWHLERIQEEYAGYWGRFIYLPSVKDPSRKDNPKDHLDAFITAGMAPVIGARFKTEDYNILQPFNYVDYINDNNIRAMIFSRWPDFLAANNRDGHQKIDVDPSTDYRGNWDFLLENGSSVITTDRPMLMHQYLEAQGLRTK